MTSTSTTDVDQVRIHQARIEQGVTQQLILLPLRTWLVIFPVTQLTAAFLYRDSAPIWMYGASAVLLFIAALGQILLQQGYRRVPVLLSDRTWRTLATLAIVTGCLAQGLTAAMFALLPGDLQRTILLVTVCFVVTLVPSRWDAGQFLLSVAALVGPLVVVLQQGGRGGVPAALVLVLALLLVLFNVAAFDARRQTRRLIARRLVTAENAPEGQAAGVKQGEARAEQGSRAAPHCFDARLVAQANERSRATFLARLSHELRTPLNGVVGTAELLERETLTDRQKRLVHTVQLSATAVLGVLDDVMSRAQNEAGTTLEEAPFSLRDLISGECDALAAHAERKQLALVSEVAPDTPDLLSGDVMRVRQVLLDLADHAIKSTESGRIAIAVRAHPAGENRLRLELSVRDSGPGLTQEEIDRLFLPVAVSDGADTADQTSGLANVRRLARMMAGDVTVESDPGRGTTFTVLLELGIGRKTAAAATAPIASAFGASESLSRTVLVVDDSELNLHVLCEQLKTLGVPHDTAADGLQGLAKWRSQPYALVISDIYMPCMDGLEMTRQIRAEEALKGRRRTPIVALTANARRGVDEQAIAAGVDDYLTKPLMLRRLQETLEHWTAAPAAQVAAAAPAPESEPIDRAQLLEMVGGNRDVVDSVLRRFAGVGEGLVREIGESLNDGERLKRLAHKLKGTARSVCAERLGDVAEKLELSRSAAGFAALEEEWRRVAAALDAVPPVKACAAA